MAFTRLVHPLAWTAVLAGLGIALGARLRPAPGALAATLPHRRGHALHRALAFIVGAWAIAAAGGSPASAAGGHLHAEPAVAGLAFTAVAIAMTALGGWLVAVELHIRRAEPGARALPRTSWPGSVRHAAEAASTTVMLAAMAVPGVLAALA
jgi:hypothetical protein